MQFLRETSINCPYCGEMQDVLVDDSAGEQSYYEDCAICCAPILFVLTQAGSGEIYLDVNRDDE